MRSLFVSAVLGALFGLAGCASVLNSITSRDEIAIRSDISYSAGARGSYDLYLPDDAGPNTPVVVFFYGGNWASGDKDRYLFVGQSLAAAGIIAAIPDYRIYPEVTFPAFVEDGAQAVSAVLHASRGGHSGIPAGDHPIFLMGHSAGAHIAALLNYDDRYLRSAGVPASVISGFVGLAGPYDFLPLNSERYRRIFPAGTRDASQPVNFVDASDPPALLISGSQDDTVDPSNSRALVQKAAQEGGRVKLRFFPDIGHVGVVVALATATSNDSQIRDAVLAFIRRQSGDQHIAE